MAELATIARPYADALFRASLKDLAATQSWLQSFATVAANKDLQAFARNPTTSSKQVIDLVVAAAKVTPTPAASNFLVAVVEGGRLAALPEIAVQFQALKNSTQGVNDAVIYSAFPIDVTALADLIVLLEKRFARKLQCTVEVDTSLIGGVRVVVGDEVLDTSVRARLDQMKVALAA